MYHILIVEDSRISRSAFERQLEMEQDFLVLASIENAANAEILCMRGKIDLILMDVCTADDESGLDAAARIKIKYPEIKIIIMTSMPEYSFQQKAKAANCDSFWYKDASHNELIDMMERTMKGEHIFPDKTPEVRLGLSSSYELTNAEFEVLRALMQSTGDEDAAKMLGCTKANIRWHVGKILEKTGYRTRTELLIAVAQKNLIIVTPDKAFDD